MSSKVYTTEHFNRTYFSKVITNIKNRLFQSVFFMEKNNQRKKTEIILSMKIYFSLTSYIVIVRDLFSAFIVHEIMTNVFLRQTFKVTHSTVITHKTEMSSNGLLVTVISTFNN